VLHVGYGPLTRSRSSCSWRIVSRPAPRARRSAVETSSQQRCGKIEPFRSLRCLRCSVSRSVVSLPSIAPGPLRPPPLRSLYAEPFLPRIRSRESAVW
jgi:hypothetical protein